MAFVKASTPAETLFAPDKAAEPVIPQGARLLCSSKIAPQDGDFIVLAPQDGSTPFVRQFVKQQDGSILLSAPNRGFDSYVSSQAELSSSGRLLTVLRMERDFPAIQRAGSLLEPAAQPEAAAPQTAEKEQANAPAPVETAAAQDSVQDASEQAAPEGLLTFEEAKAALKVQRTKMYALLRSGELKALKVGKLWRIEKASILEYLRAAAFNSIAGK